MDNPPINNPQINNPQIGNREFLEKKVNGSRANLLWVIAFTLINITLVLVNSDVTFLFSAMIPYFCVSMGAYTDIPLAVGFILGILTLAPYFLCWLFSKKHYGWFIAALAMISLDTVFLIAIHIFIQDISGIINLAIHGWIIYEFIVGIRYGCKLRNAPMEAIEPIQEPEFPQLEISSPLRRADMEVKFRVLLEADYNGRHICYRRVKRVNELVIDGYVYDDIEMLVETSHALNAKLDGHRYQVGYNGAFQSYLRVDGNKVKTKLRLV